MKKLLLVALILGLTACGDKPQPQTVQPGQPAYKDGAFVIITGCAP